MTTPLTKPLKRELQIQGRPFVVTLSPEGIKLVLKGKRKGQELRWEDLVSGEAALAVALNASLKAIPQPAAGAQTAPDSHRSQMSATESAEAPRAVQHERPTNVTNSRRSPERKRRASRASKTKPKRLP